MSMSERLLERGMQEIAFLISRTAAKCPASLVRPLQQCCVSHRKNVLDKKASDFFEKLCLIQHYLVSPDRPPLNQFWVSRCNAPAAISRLVVRQKSGIDAAIQDP